MSKSSLVTYGLDSIQQGGKFPKGINQLTIELLGFSRNTGSVKFGGVTKEQHCKNILMLAYPWVVATMNSWLEMIIWAWCNYEEVGASGSMASGKTWGFSLMCWLEWSCASQHSACILSSTTKAALRTRIWHTMKQFRAGLIVENKAYTFPSHLIDSQTLLQATKGDDMHTMTCVALEGGVLQQAWGNLIGRHPKRIACFVDEGEQCPDAIFSSRFNMRGGTEFYRFATAANAVNPSSAYGQFIEPKGGWATARDSDDYWETRTGICLHFDALKSPNVIAGRRVVPGLVMQQDIDAVREAKGEDSLEWWAQIRGFPPMSGVRNTVLSWAAILSGKAQDSVIWQGETRWIGALDPAHTSDGDNCVLRFARVGTRADGRQTLGLEPPIYIHLTAGGEITEDYQIALRVKQECSQRNMKGGDFILDSTSASGTASIIEQIWQPGIKRVNFGSSPTDRRMPSDTKTAKQRCRYRLEELWFAFAEIVKAGQVRGLDPTTGAQFCARKYRLEGEKYILQPKSIAGRGFAKSMKEDTGRGSPDEGDCTVLLGDLFRDIAGIDSPAGKAASSDWMEKAAKYRLTDSYSAS